MSSYLKEHAFYYDIFYADKPYAKEAEFVHQRLEEFSGNRVERVIELACGTGSHALALEKYGYKITAIDYSEDMLARARTKAEKNASSVRFLLNDMRTHETEGGPFDAAICLFDSIGYVNTNDAVVEVLRRANDHLRDRGLFLFEFWHAAAMLRHYEPTRVRRWSTDQGQLVRISETQLDVLRQLAIVTYSIHHFHRDGFCSSLTETQTNRYFLVQEMSALLAGSGFTPLKWYAGFDQDEEITLDTWHIVAVAQKSTGTYERPVR
jgi:SAM-dependent methyltransferase